MDDDFYLPPEYLFLDDATALGRIREQRRRLGSALGLWVHAYQRAQLVEIADFVGDGVALATRAARRPLPRRLVCASVRYVAENARLLAPASTAVWCPEPTAGCPMSDALCRADLERAAEVLRAERPYDRLLPLVSITSSLEVKAFAGEHGGACVGSSNARALLAWALGHAERVLWVPDTHLLASAARALDVDPSRILQMDPAKPPTEAEIVHARIVIVASPCPVLSQFRAADVEAARRAHPGAQVWVQHDLPAEVVAASDGAGSLAELAELAASTPRHAPVVLGTEIHAIDTLRGQVPDRHFFPLATAFCSSMYSISLAALLSTLDRLEGACAEAPLGLDIALVEPARNALVRMLDIGTTG